MMNEVFDFQPHPAVVSRRIFVGRVFLDFRKSFLETVHQHVRLTGLFCNTRQAKVVDNHYRITEATRGMYEYVPGTPARLLP